MNEYTLWLLLAYVSGSVVTGWMVSRTRAENIIADTIDSLIAQGYLKTSGTGKDLEILKHKEWNENG